MLAAVTRSAKTHSLPPLSGVGPVSRQWLEAIGVRTRADMQAVGPVGAYRALRQQGYPASLNLVHALEASLRDVPVRALPEGVRSDLRARVADALRPRCAWCGTDPSYVRYHDTEWGVPVHDDRVHFEFLLLEGAQAGLSWSTILAKRARYRTVFAGFDPGKVARYGPPDVARLLRDPGIVRNRLKIQGAVRNARAFLAVQEAFGSYDAYVWRFVDGRPVQNARRTLAEVPATTPVSDALSRDLRQRGFTFVGSTIMYAAMQATGLVNDHVTGCFRHRALGGRGRG